MSLPNKLTISRMVLAGIIIFLLIIPWQDLGIVFPTFYVMGRVVVDLKFLIAGFLFVIASVTDYLDGAIARKEKSMSDFGAVMDAIADKILVDGVLIILAYLGFISVIVPVVAVVRDICMDSMRILAAKKGTIIKAQIWGKAKTVFLLIGISLLLFYNLPFEIWGIYLAEIFIDIGTVLSVISLVIYFIEWKNKIGLKLN